MAMQTGHRSRTDHQDFWRIIMLIVLLAVAGFGGFLVADGIDLRAHEGFLLPAIALGLGIAFSTVYVKFSSALERGEARRSKLRSEVLEAIQKVEQLRQDESAPRSKPGSLNHIDAA